MAIPNTDRDINSMERLSIDKLYDCYYNELVLWADTILNDLGMAEDLVQDLFVALWEKGIHQQLDERGTRAYLYTSVRNKAMRKLQGERKMVTVPEVSEILAVWEEVNFSQEELLNTVMLEMEKLPPRTREVLECIHLKNMKYAEVAETLGISISTVKTLLVRSLKTLRESLSDTTYLLYVVFFQSRKM